jgi:DNA (cytosine-5)-methyltransferase 1
VSAFLDLFAGIGGFALGAYWAGLRFDEHYYSEVDDYAIRVYQQRFPDAIGLGDITKIDGTKLPKGGWIIAGGFPCQDISVAGKGAGLRRARSVFRLRCYGLLRFTNAIRDIVERRRLLVRE